jgi:hypothetical protein
MTTANRLANVGMVNSRWSWLYKTSGTAALLAGVLFLIALADLIITGLGHGTLQVWLSPFQNNWLVIIFKLHAGVAGFQVDKLQVFNFLDLAILALVAIMYLGLYAALHATSKIWSIIALIQPFLGMALFIATKSAGRSSVMGAGLVISAVMLRGNTFNKLIAYAGLLASGLLLAGDLSAGVIPPSSLVAALFGIGYVLLMLWLFLIARRLFQVGALERKAAE